MSSLKYIDTIIHKNAFINNLYEICKPYNNQYISCTIIGKFFYRRKFIVKKIYNKITQLINDNNIQFLTLCSIKDTFYVNLLLEHNTVKNNTVPLENIASSSPENKLKLHPKNTLELHPKYTELDIIYLLYEYIIVNGFKKTPSFTQNTINILSDKLGDFYKKYDSVKEIIKSNKGIIFFIKKYANNLIFIEKITDTSFILYIEG
jgi:hypothetical protein